MIVHELEHPIVQAPMAGGPSTVTLASAVSEAGGLGFIASGYRSAREMREEIRAVRARTTGPFGVNLFVPRAAEVDPGSLRSYLSTLSAEVIRYGTELGEPHADDDDWQAKLTVLAAERPPVVSFTFGCPSAALLEALHGVGCETWITVTDVAEARLAVDAGADALVLQGIEAGGHRGSFLDLDDSEGLALLPLIRLAAAETELPLIASGGITDGPALASVLVAGAAAGQLGSAFLRAPQAATSAAHRALIGTDAPTALTRAFSGRLARGIVNRFMTEHSLEAPVAYPQIHHATAPLRAAARERGDAGGFNLWAGQAHRLTTERPAGEIVTAIAEDARRALEDARSRRP